MLRIACVLAAAVLGLAGSASAAECRRAGLPAGAKAGAAQRCAPKLEPETGARERLQPGRTPGFIALGNGTEIRIGGRVRFDAIARHYPLD
ncbi:MAG TPA: hypothetical protein VHG30_19030 [Microvirga sp.]|jgi:hypothetical protein|nr:hypothetical protein [Microvirga sp.]